MPISTMLYSNLSPSNTGLVTADPLPSFKPESLLTPLEQETKATVEVVDKPPPPPRSPVDLLREMFARNEFGQAVLVNQHNCMSFARPSKEATDAYDLSVVQAIRFNEMETLRSMLRDGKSFNACNRFGESLIHMVCRRGNIDMASFLIKEARVDVDVRDDFGRTPMHDACWTSKPNVAMMDLLINNVSPEMLLTEDVRGHTPFDYARKEHYDEWCDYLISKEEDLQRRITTIGWGLEQWQLMPAEMLLQDQARSKYSGAQEPTTTPVLPSSGVGGEQKQRTKRMVFSAPSHDGISYTHQP